MEKILSIASNIASIISLIVSLLVVNKVFKIYKNTNINNSTHIDTDNSTNIDKGIYQNTKGKGNKVAGRDIIDK